MNLRRNWKRLVQKFHSNNIYRMYEKTAEGQFFRRGLKFEIKNPPAEGGELCRHRKSVENQ